MTRITWAAIMVWTTARHLWWCCQLYPTDLPRIARWLRRNWILYRWVAQGDGR